jgi:flagellar M-ring protein FliF
LNDIKNLIARAVGYDEERGDKIEVLNIPFEAESNADEKGLLEKAERKELIFNVSQYVFYLVIVVAIFFFVIRPLLSIFKRRGPALPLKQVKDVYVKGAGPEGAAAIEDKNQGAISEALKDKALVGTIIKEWVKEGA